MGLGWGPANKALDAHHAPSHACRQLARELGAALIDKDDVRDVFQEDTETRRQEENVGHFCHTHGLL